MNTFFIRKTIKLLVLSVLFLSCQTEPITPGNYQSGTPSDISNDWVNDYVYSGVLPEWPTNFSVQNELVGTTWVLVRITNGYATTFPNDTIRFVTNTNYTLNNGAIRQYQLSSGISTTNKTLTLYHFQPFGGSHYSGQVGYHFVNDGAINQAEFHNIQNTTNTLLAWFVKL
jgi:hypothetical protein